MRDSPSKIGNVFGQTRLPSGMIRPEIGSSTARMSALETGTQFFGLRRGGTMLAVMTLPLRKVTSMARLRLPLL
jgi:hypothetical protein